MPPLPPAVRRTVASVLAARPLSLFLLGAVGALVAFAAATRVAVQSTGPVLGPVLGSAGVDRRLAELVLGWTVTMVAGYATTLHVLLPTLRADAAIPGRSAVAGSAAAGAFLIACLLLGPAPERARLAAAALCGAGIGAVVLWPWRVRRAERHAAQELDAA
jgi:hypothetical protein